MFEIKNGCGWRLLLAVVAVGLCWPAFADERACVLPTDWIGDPGAVVGHTFKIQFDYRFDALGFFCRPGAPQDARGCGSDLGSPDR